MRLVSCLVCLAACGPADSPWSGDVDVSDALEVIATKKDGLARPQDLAFDPDVEGRLWVVNRNDDSVTLIDDAYEAASAQHIIDPYALHFMEEVSSIAFGAPGMFGTCQDSRNTYNHHQTGNDFMGPALWSSDLDIFAKSNPDAVDYLTDLYGFPTDLGSHLDMLHQSPLCVGIAWEKDNVYWVFDGDDSAIVRYDFREDHGPGFDDHSDGVIDRYVRGEVGRVEDHVSHLVLDEDTRELFIADTANGRIAVLDIDSGTAGKKLPVMEPGTKHTQWDGADLTTFADGLDHPSGIELVDDHVLVTETGTGLVHVFDREGKSVATLDTGLGADSLAGLIAVSLDDVWMVDAKGNQVLHLLADE